MNDQSRFDQWCDAIDQVMRETGTRSRMDAAEIARRRYPHLANARPDESASRYSGAASTGGTAEAQLNVLARELSRQMHIPFAQAYAVMFSASGRRSMGVFGARRRCPGHRRGSCNSDPNGRQRFPPSIWDRGQWKQEQVRAAAAVFQALRHAEVRFRPEFIRIQREPFEANGDRAETFAEGTRFSKHRLWHVEVQFNEGFPGPVVIGDGRFLGLGIMAPVRSEQSVTG
jgi:hypothetical protein